jgi:hypothetical protein
MHAYIHTYACTYIYGIFVYMHIYTHIHVHLCVHILYIDFSSTPKSIPAGSGNLSFCFFQILEWLPTWMEIKIFIFFPGNSGKITMLAQNLSSYRSRWPIYFTYMGKIPWHHIIPMCFFNSVATIGPTSTITLQTFFNFLP